MSAPLPPIACETHGMRRGGRAADDRGVVRGRRPASSADAATPPGCAGPVLPIPARPA